MRFTRDTTTQSTNLRGRSWLARFLLVLGAVALLTSSCSSDDDDSGAATESD